MVASSRTDEFSYFVIKTLRDQIDRQSPSEALNTAFDFDKRVYELEGEQAIKYDDGVHTQHRHMQYHTFFVDNVRSTHLASS